MQPKFHFTVTDVARLLGKSPVTLRGWERQGLITFPREGTDRKLTCEEVLEVAERAKELGRITEWRKYVITMTMATLMVVERENEYRKRK